MDVIIVDCDFMVTLDFLDVIPVNTISSWDVLKAV